MKLIKFSAFLLLFVFSACTDKQITSTTENEKKQIPPVFQDAESYAADVDQLTLQEASSLSYSKPDGSFIEVSLFANDSNEVVKLIEYLGTGNGGSVNKTIFYYKDNKKVLSRELFDDSDNKRTSFVERVTYYKENKAKLTKQRMASYEELIENETFQVVQTKECSDERAYDALKQIGEFETTFQGFVKDDALLYMLVGPNTSDGYVSSLVVQLTTPLIQKLLSNEKAMIGKRLKVEFETMTGENNFNFQVLINAQLNE